MGGIERSRWASSVVQNAYLHFFARAHVSCLSAARLFDLGRLLQAVSYVSRRRMDQADFDPYEIDTDGLPLVYNEERIASFWKGKPGMCY